MKLLKLLAIFLIRQVKRLGAQQVTAPRAAKSLSRLAPATVLNCSNNWHQNGAKRQHYQNYDAKIDHYDRREQHEAEPDERSLNRIALRRLKATGWSLEFHHCPGDQLTGAGPFYPDPALRLIRIDQAQA